MLGTLSTTVFANRLHTSLTALGVPGSVATSIAHSAGGRQAGTADAAPAGLRGAIDTAVSQDFAFATRAVLYGMALALAVAFLVSLLHPGDNPETVAAGAGAGAGAGAASGVPAVESNQAT